MKTCFMKNLVLTLAVFTTLLILPGRMAAAANNTTTDRSRVENGLLPAVVLDGHAEPWNLESRMRRWNVPGVSIAVLRGGEIAWASAYGVLDTSGMEPMTVSTRMQAASVSKPVAATAALSLVANGTLDLDEDINTYLRSWKLPASELTREHPVTLRRLLSHTAGLSVPGYFGYAQGEPIPTLNQILDGAPPSNARAVVSKSVPGTELQYSGGGYQVMQRLLEDVSGQDFAGLLAEHVFVPADMTESSYQPMTSGSLPSGHDLAGNPIEGNWRVHPELAAAGLWTTPIDLAKFSLALTRSIRQEEGGLLPDAVATEMMTPVFGFAGLGPAVEGEGRNLRILHAGENEGFRSYWLVYPAKGDGIVVMVNGDGGLHLIREIVRAAAATYDWDGAQPTTASSFALPDTVLAELGGTWTEQGDDSNRIVLRLKGLGLEMDSPQGTFPFIATGINTMLCPETGQVMEFAIGNAGEPTLTMDGMSFRRR